VRALVASMVRGEKLRAKAGYTNDRRRRPMVTLTLSPEALARLDAIASERGQSRSGAVEQLIRRARLGSDGK
jgi:hypothetical protein